MLLRTLVSRLRIGGRAIQFGVLPFRRTEDGLQIMLVTSRSSGRWILPKGWRAHGLAPHLSAAKEAFEEAGLRGATSERSIGVFRHLKTGFRREVRVEIFPMEVTEQLDDWPERFQRRRQWFNVHQAALAVSNPSVRRVIGSFRP
jgi:8-oxo-dGTP pyrophosphatase MutT (NUDIX family)